MVNCTHLTQLQEFALNLLQNEVFDHKIEFCISVYNLPQKYPSAGKNGCSTQLASSIFVTRMRTTKVVSLAFLQNLLWLTNVPKRFTTTKASTQKGNEDALRQEIYGINQEV